MHKMLHAHVASHRAALRRTTANLHFYGGLLRKQTIVCSGWAYDLTDAKIAQNREKFVGLLCQRARDARLYRKQLKWARSVRIAVREAP